MEDNGQEKLYHYTTCDAFTSIVQTKQLWFTDFRFLNDSEELRYVSGIVNNTLKAYDFYKRRQEFFVAAGHLQTSSDLQSPYTFDDMIKNLRAGLKRLVAAEFDSANPSTSIPYVFSLSGAKDSLSQWRAYGRGELCIEFDREKLTQVMGMEPFKVRYQKRNATSDDLRLAIDEFLENKLRLTRRTGHLDREVVVRGADDLRGFISRKLIPIAIKHDGFREEREWRLVCSITPGIWRLAPPESPKNPARAQCFFYGGRYSIPRAKYLISEDIRKVSEIISGVMFGPGSDRNLAFDTIGALNLAIGTNFKVEFSDIPYRS